MRTSKYRHRTALREVLPERLGALFSKGSNDCGEHEWYKSAESTWRCYHCEVGVTHEVPWDEREIAARRLEAGAMNVRAGITRPDPHPSRHSR